jgi:hypothetical protein
MKNPLQFTIVLGLAAAGLTLAASDVMAQSKSQDAAAVREAIRFERAKDAADRRQLRAGASHPGQASQATGSADRLAAETPDENTAERKVAAPRSDGAAVGEAIRFERFKDGAAARQMRLDARQAGTSSPVALKTRNTKQ